MAYYGFALTATHFFSNAKKSKQKTLAPTFGPLAGARGSFAPGSIRAQRLRFASLHLLSLCLASPNGRCAPTPGSIPPLSLPTSPCRSKTAAELTLILLSSEKRALFAVGFLWALACQRWRPASRPSLTNRAQSSCGGELAGEDGLPATEFSLNTPSPHVGAAEGCDLLICFGFGF